MNNPRLYLNMLVKLPLDDSNHHKNIFQNVYDDKIVGFNKINGTDFLSNSYPSVISFEGLLYPTVQHAYEASKTNNLEIRELIRKCKTASDAKKLSRSITVEKEWVESKIRIMKNLIREKFQNPFLRHMLLLTDNLKLIHENSSNDKFWGVLKNKREGENWLGKILEEVREEIKSQENDF